MSGDPQTDDPQTGDLAAALAAAACPLPLDHREVIVMGHGSGGRLTERLIQRVFLPHFANPALLAGDDAAVLPLPGGRWAVSTDAHVVTPLFFPGGDIGRLAVCGTVNDVAMLGGTPRFLSAAFILEEGLPVATLERVVISMAQAAAEAGVQIVTGDTKVIGRGTGAPGMYITTTGLGWIPDGVTLGGAQAQPGDAILLSGTLGDHGIAVLAARGDLGLETAVASDVAPLNGLVQAALAVGGVHVLRDPTRGGAAATLNEIAHQAGVDLLLEETALPVCPAVAAACDLLGFDPLTIANEGKCLVICAAAAAAPILAALRAHPLGRAAVQIGTVQPARDPHSPRLLAHTPYGTTRIVDTPTGEILPRIC